MNDSSELKTDIVILGAGIGGYETFRTLARLFKKTGSTKKITIVDRNNYFTFTPMLHEVAAGSIEPAHCTLSLRALVQDTPHHFLRATVTHIDPAAKTVTTDQGVIHYEYAVAALGSGVNFFNTPGASEHCFQTRTLERAMRLRHELIQRLESGQEHIVISVVGGGYTGIETASQLLYLINRDLKKLYPRQQLTVRVIEAGPAILNNLPQSVQQKVLERLTKQGLSFLLEKKVLSVSASAIELSPGTSIPSDITIWCAGVQNNAGSFFDETYVQKGRLPTDAFLRHPLSDSLYAVGDMAEFFNPGSAKPSPQLGETAHAEGRYVARHIAATVQNQNIKPFFFRSRGMLIPIGDWYGVMAVGNLYFFGRIAWVIRRTVYILFMPGIIRKLNILVDWTLHSFGFRYIIDLD